LQEKEVNSPKRERRVVTPTRRERESSLSTEPEKKCHKEASAAILNGSSTRHPWIKGEGAALLPLPLGVTKCLEGEEFGVACDADPSGRKGRRKDDYHFRPQEKKWG